MSKSSQVIEMKAAESAKDEKPPSLTAAKAHLFQAAHSIDPLRPMRENPLTTVGVGLISGFLMGSREHPAIMKTLKVSMGLIGVLKPVLLAAGKYAATKVAEKGIERVEENRNAAVGVTGQVS